MEVENSSISIIIIPIIWWSKSKTDWEVGTNIRLLSVLLINY